MKSFLKIRNIVYFLLAFFFLVVHSRLKTPKKPNTLAIIQLAKLGDMVCTTPMFCAVKKKFPKTRLIVVGNSINKELLSGNPNIDCYIVHDPKETFWRTASALREEQVDVCIVAGVDFIGLLIAVFSGSSIIVSPRAVGGKALQTKTYTSLLPLVYTQEFRFGFYAPQERLRLLETVGIYSNDVKKHLYFSSKAEEEISELFSVHNITKENFLVGISPGVGNTIKQWPAKHFAEVTNFIGNTYNATIIIIGSPSDNSEIEAMSACLNPSVSTIDARGLNIDALKALIAKLNMFISVDTGPIYITEAFGVPTIDIVGPMDEREQPPVGKFNKIVVAPRTEAQLHILNARLYDEKEAARQVHAITPQMVIQTFEELYNEIKK